MIVHVLQPLSIQLVWILFLHEGHSQSEWAPPGTLVLSFEIGFDRLQISANNIMHYLKSFKRGNARRKKKKNAALRFVWVSWGIINNFPLMSESFPHISLQSLIFLPLLSVFQSCPLWAIFAFLWDDNKHNKRSVQLWSVIKPTQGADGDMLSGVCITSVRQQARSKTPSCHQFSLAAIINQIYSNTIAETVPIFLLLEEIRLSSGVTHPMTCSIKDPLFIWYAASFDAQHEALVQHYSAPQRSFGKNPTFAFSSEFRRDNKDRKHPSE